MRISVGEIPTGILTGDDPQIGDVYRVQGGRGHSKRYHMIVGISENGDTCYMLAFDRAGNVCGASQYGTHYFQRKERIGRAEFPSVTITWEGPWA